MNVSEKVAFIRGLVEGLDIDLKNNKEGKVLAAIIDLLDDLAISVIDLKEDSNNMWDQIEGIDEDLAALEDDAQSENACTCGCHEHETDDCFYEVTCPKCNETVCLSEEILLDGEIDCPKCGEVLEFDFDNLEDSDEKDQSIDQE